MEENLKQEVSESENWIRLNRCIGYDAVIRTIPEVEDIIRKYNAVIERAQEIVGRKFDVERLELHWATESDPSNDRIDIIGSDENGEYESDLVPINWLFLNSVELEKAKKVEAERREAVLEEYRAKLAAAQKAHQEDLEREEYERLRRKFEGVE